MSLGAIVIPFVALAICLGGMWFAWRLVGGSERTDENRRQSAAPAPQPQPASATGTRLAGPIMALAGMSLGIGGITYAIARAYDMDSPLLAAVVLPAGFCLAAAGIWMWRVRRRAARRGVP